MKLRIIENTDNYEEYGVLYNFKKENQLAVFDSKEDALDFLNAIEITGKDAFHVYDPVIMTKQGGFTVDDYGNSYYTATTPEGRKYQQKIKVVNNSPVYIEESFMKKSNQRTLKESDELARKLFVSLTKDKYGYYILNDGYYVCNICAKDDEDAIEQFYDFLDTDWKTKWKEGTLPKYFGESYKRKRFYR